ERQSAGRFQPVDTDSHAADRSHHHGSDRSPLLGEGPDLRARDQRQQRSRAQYHSYAADQTRRLPESRGHVQPPLAEYYGSPHLGPHILSDHDERSSAERVARLPPARLRRFPLQLRRGAGIAESFTGLQLARAG